MANWVARVQVRCTRGARTARFVGPSANEALRKGLKFNPGPGCEKGAIEMIQRGVGAGAVDRYHGERGEGLDGSRRKRRPRRRRRR